MPLMATIATVSAQSSTTPVTGKLGDAVKYYNETTTKTVSCVFPKTGAFVGSINGTTNGTGIAWVANFASVPTSNLPYSEFHIFSPFCVLLTFLLALLIYNNPVPASGVCGSSLGGLFDPYQRGLVPACNKSNTATCAIGDVSGKYGYVTSSPFVLPYLSLYTNVDSQTVGYVGGRSFVITTSNGTIMACANLTVTSTIVFTGSAQKVRGSVLGWSALVAVFMALF